MDGLGQGMGGRRASQTGSLSGHGHGGLGGHARDMRRHLSYDRVERAERAAERARPAHRYSSSEDDDTEADDPRAARAERAERAALANGLAGLKQGARLSPLSPTHAVYAAGVASLLAGYSGEHAAFLLPFGFSLLRPRSLRRRFATRERLDRRP